MTDVYIQPHVSQYPPPYTTPRLTRMGCSPTSAANGVGASTGGKHKPSGDDVLAKVSRSEEVDPTSEGWSLDDVDLAMARMHIPFVVIRNEGWAGVVAAHNAGYYVIVQGDSDRFPGTTCSGAFDGKHCIGTHPDEDAAGHWRIDDPICHSARYEKPETIRAYAEHLFGTPKVYFGKFTDKVPALLPDTSTEDAMKFDNRGPVLGIATMEADWPLWYVDSNARSPKQTKGTQFQVFGVVRYHPTGGKAEGYIGFLVDLNGRAAILPRDNVSHARLVGSTATL